MPRELNLFKKDYNDLFDSYEKSEKIRIGQKELINTLKAEIDRLNKRQSKSNLEDEKPKNKIKKKVSKASNKSSTRVKSKKPRKLTKN
jgi:hypothetical protein